MKRIHIAAFGIGFVTVAKIASLLKFTSLMFMEDMLAMHFGAVNGGATLESVIIVLSFALLIWYIQEKNRK